MELLEFRCACRQKLEAPRTLAGRKAQCPTCRADVEIPAVEPDREEALAEVRMVPCPACAEPIVHGVEKCEHCKERLEWEKGRGTQAFHSRANRWRAYRDRPGLPWDDPTRGTRWSRLVDTLKALVFQPVTAFRSTPPEGGFGTAYTFCLSMVLASSGIVFLWVATVSMAAAGSGPSGGAAGFGIIFGFALAVMNLASGSIGPLLTGLLFHVCLMMVGGARRSLDATLRVSCFAYGTTAIVSAVLPVVGPNIALVWTLALQAIGARELHEISGVRATIAAVIPSLFAGSCCSCPMIRGF